MIAALFSIFIFIGGIWAATAGLRFAVRRLSQDRTIEYYQKRIAELEVENTALRNIIAHQDVRPTSPVVKVIDGGVLVPHRRH